MDCLILMWDSLPGINGDEMVAQLSVRNERFCKIMASGKTRTLKETAIKAGYSPKSADKQASDIWKKPEIKKRVEELINKAAEKAGITIEYKMEMAKKAFDMALNEQRDVKAFVAILAETNRMQGHHAPPKKVEEEAENKRDNVVPELIEQYKSDY